MVRAVRERRPGLIDCEVAVDGTWQPAIAYPDLTGPLREGDSVVVNTTAVTLGLGTGGAHLVMGVEACDDTELSGLVHAMKMRYTPVQTAVAAVEESGSDQRATLDGIPVIAAGLHSALAPAVIAIRANAPGSRVAYIQTDAAALPLAYSDTVAALTSLGLIDLTVTAGQSFGGHVEAINVASGMLAAAEQGAEIMIVAMGPGNIGTGSRYGFAALEVASILNTAGALGGRPILLPRIGFADLRPRHQGVSHHSTTALSMTLTPVAVPLAPVEDPVRRSRIYDAFSACESVHSIVEVPLGAAEQALANAPVPLSTMGRTLAEEPEYFRAAAAAGVYAASLPRP